MAYYLVTIVLVATAFCRLAGASPVDPQRSDPKVDEPPIPIFLNAPADLEAFWKLLARPDFVVLEGDQYRKLRQAAGEAAGPSKPALTAVLESLAASGDVVGDWARLAVEYRVVMANEGPTWFPIRLDGQTVTEVREGITDLPTRAVEGQGWQVELKGRGDHIVRVGLIASVRSTVEGRRLELAVPPAPATRIDLTVPRSVLDASTGPNEEVGLISAGGGEGIRLAARLSPRSRIELAWRERADPANRLPTLLSARGEISMEIERGSIRSRSSWVVESIRGTASQLAFRLDAAEELLDIEVDGKPIQVEARREGGRSLVAIPLAEPLRPGSKRTLDVGTRRPIASGGAVRITLQGYSFDQARVQSGMIAIARSGPIYIKPAPGRGLRRIDPRTELPESLRGRPDTTLAFEFNDQPFELGLEVDPAPPNLRAEARTTVAIDPRQARIQTRLDCRTSQGKIFEVQVLLPRGLEFEKAEPPEVVESARVVASGSDDPPSPGTEGPRTLILNLTPQARESELDAFTIVLKGWSAIDPSDTVNLPLFRPIVDAIERARLVITSERNVAVEPAAEADGGSPFRVDWGPPPPDWPWPSKKPGPGVGLLWLGCDANPERLPLNVVVRPRSIRHESILSATVGQLGADVVDVVSGEVAFGVVSQLDVALPPEVPDHWEVEGVELSRRDPIGRDAGGVRRFRLGFAREFTDAFQLRFRYRAPFVDPPQAGRPARLRLATIQVLEGTCTGRKVMVSAETGFEFKADPRGWAPAPTDPSPDSEGGPPVRLALVNPAEKPGPFDLEVSASSRLAPPSLVASRLWLRTIQRPENDLAASARLWVETHDDAMTVALPPGSSWVRARIGGLDLTDQGVDLLGEDRYRLRFPAATPPGPVLVAIDFVIQAGPSATSRPAFLLLDGGVIQQTLWEAQVSGSRAGVGTPAGWTDENEWYWAGGPWKRRPRMSPLELSSWLMGGSTRYQAGGPPEPADAMALQAYLFGRVGPPIALHFPVFSRFALVLLCSGPALTAGLLVLARRPPPRALSASLLALGFAAGVLIEPDVLILVAQSSTLGAALWLIALAIHWAIGRTALPRTSTDRALIASSPMAGSSMARPPSAGSDDSTAIRPRPLQPSVVSTADHVVLVRTSIPDLHDEPDER